MRSRLIALVLALLTVCITMAPVVQATDVIDSGTLTWMPYGSDLHTADVNSVAQHPYVACVEEALLLSEEAREGGGYGVLYDVDRNGIEELLMIYSVPSMYEGTTDTVCSVYTISMHDGKVRSLLEKEYLFTNAGGPFGWIGVVEDAGTPYLCIVSESGETGNGDDPYRRGGTWDLYQINGETIEKTTEVEYNFTNGYKSDPQKSGAEINGRKCTYPEFEEWVNSFKVLVKVDDYYSYYSGEPRSCLTLEELLDRVQNGLQNAATSDEKKTVGGVLRSIDDAEINWSCTYNETSNGESVGAQLVITGNASSYDELYILDSGNVGFPWEYEPYADLRQAITSVEIRGSLKTKLQIADNAFQDYDALESVVCTNVSEISSNCFKNCKSLKEVTLDDMLIEIGGGAFSDCDKVIIKCYANSATHQYAVNNGIPYEYLDIGEEFYEIYYDNGMIETFPCDLKEYVSRTASTTYNPDLAHMLAAMSCSAYDQTNVTNSLLELGFAYDDIYMDYDNATLCFSIAKQQMDNDKRLVLITIRGTKEFLEWISNITITEISLYDLSYHAGFDLACHEVNVALTDFLDNDFENTVFVVTGHSRGAAVSNLLAWNLTNAGVPQTDIFSYNFGCPDVATTDNSLWNSLNKKCKHIYNIGHAGDIVTIVPGRIDATKGPWGKFGQSYWFANDWNDNSELVTADVVGAHSATGYLSYMRKEYDLSKYKDRTETQFFWVFPAGSSIHAACPVDVAVMNSSGNPLASIVDGKVNYHNSVFGEVIAMTDGEEKIIYVKGNETLYVSLYATGNGSMTYSVSHGESPQIVYENVQLAPGKIMSSEISATNESSTLDIADVPLYVLNDEKIPVSEVLADGTGNEIAVLYSEDKVMPVFDFQFEKTMLKEMNNYEGIIRIAFFGFVVVFVFGGYCTVQLIRLNKKN